MEAFDVLLKESGVTMTQVNAKILEWRRKKEARVRKYSILKIYALRELIKEKNGTTQNTSKATVG